MLTDTFEHRAASFRCQPGLTQQDIAELLAALPQGLAHVPAAVLESKRGGQPGALLLASVELMRLAGAADLADLSRFLYGESARREQLRVIARRLAAGRPAQPLTLTASIGSVTRTFTFLCRLGLAAGEAPLFLAVALIDVFDQHRETIDLRDSHEELSGVGAAGRGSGSLRAAPRGNMRPASRRGAGVSREMLDMELRRQKAEFRELSAILDTATDGVAVLDSQARILTLNRSGEALFGCDQHDVAGKPFMSLLAPESRPLAWEYFDGLNANGAGSLLNQGREVTALARQGGTIPVFLTLGRIGVEGATQESGPRFCALLRDLTHWKNAKRELEEARKEAERASALKSDFLARVSHEIRTPLNAILGFAEVMTAECFGPIGNPRYKDYLDNIHTSGTLIMSLVNDLLDLAKIEAGKMDFTFESIDVNRIVSECVSIMQPQASRYGVAIKVSLSPALPNILADERSLRQIVLNLLSNAVKFNRPQGQVIAATALADSGSAVIRIRDTGVGMPDGSLAAAFEPFQRLAGGQPSSGTGLGLPLTKALAEANHASLTIKSKEQEGTLVEVAFPRSRIMAE